MPVAAVPALPWTTEAGNASVTFRLMAPGDRQAFLAFMRAQPHDDLFFLLVDATTPEGLDQWMKDLENGHNRTVLAEQHGKLVGYGSLYHGATQWTRHMGEIRLLVAPGHRDRGLGQLLAHQVFAMAQDLGLRRMVVRFASGQRSAIRLFERLGFHNEALLADWVIDGQGHTQDLVLMSHDLASSG